MTHYPDNQIAAAGLSAALAAAGIVFFVLALHTHTHRANTDDNRTRAIAYAAVSGMSFFFASGPPLFINWIVSVCLAGIGAAATGYAFWLERQIISTPDDDAPTAVDRTRIADDADELGTTGQGLRNLIWAGPRNPCRYLRNTRPDHYEDDPR
jgi:hypothetical protein